MIIFFDFDDVLFNTKLLVGDIKEIFQKNGISEEIFKKYYYEKPFSEKDEIRTRKYSPYKQIAKLEEFGFKTEKLKKDLNKLLKNTDKYIFKDGINFIEKMKKEQLYVVSYGDDKFQKKKIINSGIRHYFKKIMIAEDTKAVAIKKVLKKRKLENSEALIFIDDREKFLRDIKKSYPGMVTFLFGRPEGRYKDKLSRYCDFEVGNFKEVLNIIKKNGK